MSEDPFSTYTPDQTSVQNPDTLNLFIYVIGFNEYIDLSIEYVGKEIYELKERSNYSNQQNVIRSLGRHNLANLKLFITNRYNIAFEDHKNSIIALSRIEAGVAKGVIQI